MVKKILKGRVEKGCRDGKNWDISDIRKTTGYDNLKPGTLNVRLAAPHNLRIDYRLPREQRTDGRDEDLYFERCRLVIGRSSIRALIARTSTNFWGNSVLEIMAEEMIRQCYGVQDGDTVELEVCAQE